MLQFFRQLVYIAKMIFKKKTPLYSVFLLIFDEILLSYAGHHSQESRLTTAVTW